MIEALVVVAIICILLAIIVPTVRGMSGAANNVDENGNVTQSSGVSEVMETYLQKAFPGYEIVSVQCLDDDKDGDGFNSCNGSVRKTPESDIQIVNVECSKSHLFNSAQGCRALVLAR